MAKKNQTVSNVIGKQAEKKALEEILKKAADGSAVTSEAPKQSFNRITTIEVNKEMGVLILHLKKEKGDFMKDSSGIIVPRTQQVMDVMTGIERLRALKRIGSKAPLADAKNFMEMADEIESKLRELMTFLKWPTDAQNDALHVEVASPKAGLVV